MQTQLLIQADGEDSILLTLDITSCYMYTLFQFLFRMMMSLGLTLVSKFDNNSRMRGERVRAERERRDDMKRAVE